MDQLHRLAAQIGEAYRAMPHRARFAAGGLLVVFVVGLVYLVRGQGSAADFYLMGGEPFPPGQIPAMEAAFSRAGLNDYEIDAHRIRVPGGRHAAYMGALADGGALPPSFGSYLEKTLAGESVFASRHDKQERLKIARQNELALIVRSMPGVEAASVLYDSKPIRGARLGMEELATATVSVKPVGSGALDPRRVSMIRNLVAGAIAGLKPENVTVADLNGRTYGGGGGDGIDELHLARRAMIEQQLELKIREALSMISGLEVHVTVEMEGDSERPSSTGHDDESARKESFALKSVRAAVAVPSDYFLQVWNEGRRANEKHGLAFPPSPSKEENLDEIESRVRRDIEATVAAILPPVPPGNMEGRIVVTKFQSFSPPEQSTPTYSQNISSWLTDHWGAVLWVFGGVCCLAILRRSYAFTAKTGVETTADPMPIDALEAASKHGGDAPADSTAPTSPLHEPDKVSSRRTRPFGFLDEADPSQLIDMLSRERSQTIALVLSHLPPERATSVLLGLDSNKQADVVARLANMDDLDEESIRAVEIELKVWLEERTRHATRRRAGLAAISGILEAADGPSKKAILDNVERHDAELARRVEDAAGRGVRGSASLRGQEIEVVRFEELEMLDNESLDRLLEVADSGIVVLALSGADEKFTKRVFSRLSRAEADALRDQIANLGPMRLRDIEAAQRELALLARRLADQSPPNGPWTGRLSVAA